MLSVSQGAAVRPSVLTAGPIRLLDRYFYFFMSLLIAAIVVWGFSHSVNENLFHPALPRPFILWIHGAVFSAWVAFFILQSSLVRTRHVRRHRTLGWFGAAIAGVMVPLGIATAVVMGRFDKFSLHQTGGEAFLIVPFFDMFAFAVCFSLALYWRKRSEFHRRMILIATCGLLDAAFGRIDFLFNHSLYFLCLDAVILLGPVRDLLVNRRVHPVYRIALPVLVILQGFVIYTLRSNSSWWVRIGHAILG